MSRNLKSHLRRLEDKIKRNTQDDQSHITVFEYKDTATVVGSPCNGFAGTPEQVKAKLQANNISRSRVMWVDGADPMWAK